MSWIKCHPGWVTVFVTVECPNFRVINHFGLPGTEVFLGCGMFRTRTGNSGNTLVSLPDFPNLSCCFFPIQASNLLENIPEGTSGELVQKWLSLRFPLILVTDTVSTQPLSQTCHFKALGLHPGTRKSLTETYCPNVPEAL